MIILWHARDLRLEDHLALTRATQEDLPIFPLYIHDPEGERLWPLGAASRWWLHHSLTDLQKRYRTLGGDLFIREGPALEIFQRLIKELPIKAVYWLKRYEPDVLERDKKVTQLLQEQGIQTSQFEGNTLIAPDFLQNKSGQPYRVFTPFYRAFQKQWKPRELLKAPKRLPPPPKSANPSIKTLQLLPKNHWDEKFNGIWKPGREGAEKHLKTFRVDLYTQTRDFPGIKGTSKLSPHLAFGEISPDEVWQKTASEPFQRQLVWREFARAFLTHFPQSTTTSYRKEFERFLWKQDAKKLARWQRGETGYPIVDAGMRQLWQTGWMHNRVRMIVGSFLVKDLMIHWIEGARWFWNTLVDADLANNTLGWQWIAGSGPDAAPYFRIFNPILQGKKFDKEGTYIRSYIPELKDVPNQWIHTPWEAENVSELDYPPPIVDHKQARADALKAFHSLL